MSETTAILIIFLGVILLFAGMIWGVVRFVRWAKSGAYQKQRAEVAARRIADVEDAYEVERSRRDRSEEE